MAYNSFNIPNLPSIAAMKALGASSKFYPTVNVAGYNPNSTLGGGIFNYTATTITPDNYINFAPDAGTGTWVRQLGQTNDLNICDFGVLPGVASSANDAFLNAAFQYMSSQIWMAPEIPTGTGSATYAYNGPCIYFPPAEVPYIYTGTGIVITSGVLSMRATPNTVSIQVPQDVWFITSQSVGGSAQVWTYIHGIQFVGAGNGMNGVLHVTAPDNGRYQIIEKNTFINYKVAAFANETNDSPYLAVTQNIFHGTANVNNFGWAWGGWVDNLITYQNRYEVNAYHVKIGDRLSGSIAFWRDDFLSFVPNNTKADIWIVPNVDPASFGAGSGRGFVIREPRVGVDNRNPGSPFILVAIEDSGSGADRSTRQPLLTWQPDGSNGDGPWLSGPTIVDGRFAGAANQNSPIIMSYINNMGNLNWHDNQFEDGSWNYILQWASQPTVNSANGASVVVLKKSDFLNPSSFLLVGVSNFPIFSIVDQSGYFGLIPQAEIAVSGSDEAGFLFLGAGNSSTIQTAGGASLTSVSGRNGIGTTGAEVTLTNIGGPNSGSFVYVPITTAIDGRSPVHIDLSLKQGSSLPLSHVNMAWYNGTDQIDAIALKTPPLQPYWKTMRFNVPTLVTATPSAWNLRIWSDAWVSGTNTKFQISDVSIYQANQVINSDALRLAGSFAGAWNGPNLIMGSYYLWIDSSGRLRIKGSAPTSDTDGTVVGTQT